MNKAFAVPEDASPPPEPPPRDYGRSNISTLQPEFNCFNDVNSSSKNITTARENIGGGDDRIRARIEACKQGMMQLDALRTKHHRLMQEMRDRLPMIPGCADIQARTKRAADLKLDRTSLQSDDSGISNSQNVPSRSTSPSISHRSSVSCDSGCSSVFSTELTNSQPSMPYSTYRKLSLEDRGLASAVPPTKDSYQSPLQPNPVPIVATTIASTTCLRSEGVTKNWRRKQQQRPRSMYDRSVHDDDESLLDSVSFSQITPPPVHRKFGIAQAPNSIATTPRSPLVQPRFAVNSSPQTHHRLLRTAQKPEIVRAKAARVHSPEMVFHASRIFVDESPPVDRRLKPSKIIQEKRQRPQSLFDSRTSDNMNEEPLYATPARVLVKDRTLLSFAPSVSSRRTAFTPVVSSRAVAVDKKVRVCNGNGKARDWIESRQL